MSEIKYNYTFAAIVFIKGSVDTHKQSISLALHKLRDEIVKICRFKIIFAVKCVYSSQNCK